jgi:hypothetical protein
MSCIRPQVKLTGTDGNAFSVMAKCIKAARKAKWPESDISAFQADAMSGDYNRLMSVVMTQFEVE